MSETSPPNQDVEAPCTASDRSPAGKAAPQEQPPEEPPEPGTDAANTGTILTDEVLLQICRVTRETEQVTPEWLAELRQIAGLLDDTNSVLGSHLEPAMTLLAALLTRLPRYRTPTHLPFGYEGPQIRSDGWIERKALQQIGKQIVGLIRHDRRPDEIALAVEIAVSEAVLIGFMEEKHYDAWRPGMPSGGGWRSAVAATLYGVAKARAALAAESKKPSIRKPSTPPAPWERPAPRTTPTDGNGGGGAAQADPKKAAEPTAASERDRDRSPKPKPEDQYEWACQIELVRATNQVLGEGILNSGVLSRECSHGHIETNGKTGRASRVYLTSFLAWVSERQQLTKDEQVQIRNAMIGEIRARNHARNS